MRIPSAIKKAGETAKTMSLQRAELYHFSAVDVFFELLKRRICYYTKKVQQSEDCELVSDGRSSMRVIRSKLRKREETSGGVLRSNVVHPEGVLQAPVVDPRPPMPPLSNTLIVSTIPDGGNIPFSPSDSSLSSCTSTESTLDSMYSEPLFLYSTGHSRNSLNSSDQSIPIHPGLPVEEEKRRKNVFRGLRRKKTPPSPTYAIPIEYHEQLKKIYVY